MLQRLGLGVFFFASIAACSASGSQDGAGDVDAAPAVGDDDSGPGAPQQYDSSPPATVGDDQPDSGGTPSTDAGDDGGTNPGGPTSCSSLNDCSSLSSKPGVAGVACTNKACVITCDATDYDVDGDPTNGCEVPDPTDDHAQDHAVDLGSAGCNDGSSAQNVLGIMASDHAAHNPQPTGFDATVGATPDYFKIKGTGGLCTDDANFELQMNPPTKQKGCYELHLLTDKNNGGQTCTTDLTGHCSITNGTASYSDGSELYIWVVKTATCTADKFPDDAPYNITGHL
jgi:hypothetical protein